MKRTAVAFALAVASLGQICPAQGHRFAFDFSESDHGFVPGFADYPVDFDPRLYELVAERRPLPANLGSAPALFSGGSNRSDDLFMFWKKRITGLPSSTKVLLTMELEFASKYAERLVGIGGAPGEGVTVKIGAVPFEPSTAPDLENWLRMNLDKGNQSVGGTDMAVVGHVAKPEDGTENYVLLLRGQHGAAMQATTAADGSLWLIFGTDSGFEGRSELYFTRLTAWIDTPEKPLLWIETGTPGPWRIVWNGNHTLQTTDDLAAKWNPVSITARPHIHEAAEPKRFWRLAPGR
jgi:hypothetical protein